ncbi:hypothetical protein AGMMS50225_06770 [Betaproteobacteria bacterium]|nr:hypothetical protein AGMMS50225_06770 [Betaproteobacteria bacterium]
MSFSDYLRADRRLVMLRILAEMPAYRSNSSIISGMLEKLGHGVSRDVVRTDLRWLEEQGQVEIDEAGPVLVVTLTDRGGDVAAGRATVDGIARPHP